MEEFSSKMIKGVVVNALGIIPKLLRPLYLIIFARLLGMQEYGIYILVAVFVEVFSKFTIMGTNGGILHLMGFLQDEKKDQFIPSVIHIAALCSFLFALLVATALYFLSPWIGENLFQKEEIVSQLQAFVWMLPFISTAYIYAGALRETMNMKYEVLNQSFLEPLIILVLGIVFIKAFGVEGLAFAHIMAHATTTTVMLLVVRKIYGRILFSKEIFQFPWRTFMINSFYYFGMRGFNLLKHHLDTFVVGRFLTLRDVAIYSAALEISSAIKRLRFVLEPILMPIVQKLEKRNLDKAEFKKYLGSVIRHLSYPCLLFLGVIVIKSAFFLSLFGKGYKDASEVLMILAIGQYFFTVFGIFEAILYMYGNTSIAFRQNAYLIVLNIFLLFVLLPLYGVIGVALSTSLSILVVGSWTVYLHYKVKGFVPINKPFRGHVSVFMLFVGLFFGLRETGLMDVSSWYFAVLFIVGYGGYVLYESKRLVTIQEIKAK